MSTDYDGGLAILNNTSFVLTCASSSWGFMCHEENDIRPGEIFYRSTGPLWQTLFVMPSTVNTRYSNGQCLLGSVGYVKVTHYIASEARKTFENGERIDDLERGLVIAKAVGLDESLIPATLNTRAKQESFVDTISQVSSTHLYAENYCCSTMGTWKVVHGGPRYHNETWKPGKFQLMSVTRDWMWEQGSFTTKSKAEYYTTQKRVDNVPPPKKINSY